MRRTVSPEGRAKMAAARRRYWSTSRAEAQRTAVREAQLRRHAARRAEREAAEQAEAERAEAIRIERAGGSWANCYRLPDDPDRGKRATLAWIQRAAMGRRLM